MGLGGIHDLPTAEGARVHRARAYADPEFQVLWALLFPLCDGACCSMTALDRRTRLLDRTRSLAIAQLPLAWTVPSGVRLCGRSVAALGDDRLRVTVGGT